MQPNSGILSILDDCCLSPGGGSDDVFLRSLNEKFAGHAHYDSFVVSRKKELGYTCFRLRHYAGDVDYNTIGFLEKNRDTLFKDLKVCGCSLFVKEKCAYSDHAPVFRLCVSIRTTCC